MRQHAAHSDRRMPPADAGAFAAAVLAAMFLGGCRQAYVDQPVTRLVPAGAVRVSQGTPPLAYPFRGGGAVYVLDLDANRLVFTGTFPAGARRGVLVIVDPFRQAVLARMEDGTSLVLAEPVNPEHEYAIWFLPAGVQETDEPALPNPSPAAADSRRREQQDQR
jgi:hypothetical protein